MNSWPGIVSCLATATIAFVLWKEFERVNRMHRAMRMVCGAMAVASLCAMAVPIRWTRERSQNGNKAIPPAPPPDGFIWAFWKRELQSGEPLNVQGTFRNSHGSAGKLFLSSFGAKADSTDIPAGGQSEFSLSTIPKQTGAGVYRLSFVSAKGSTYGEPVPFEVSAATPLSVLIIASAPDFEINFLKGWMAERGYKVVVRTSISRGKTGESLVNESSGRTDSANIVIADQRSLEGLGQGELGSLQRAIEKGEKGLIIRGDSSLGRNSFFKARLSGRNATGRLPVRLTTQLLAPLPFDHTPAIGLSDDTRPLVTAGGNVYVIVAGRGAGKVLMTELPPTYSWALSGNKKNYDLLWSSLLSEALPVKQLKQHIVSGPFFLRVNQEGTITREAGEQDSSALIVDSSMIQMAQDPQLRFIARGSFWPVGKGWQETGGSSGSGSFGSPDGKSRFYVFGENDWKTIPRPTEKTVRPQAGSPEQREFPLIIFFALFLVASAYLWFENKYYNV